MNHLRFGSFLPVIAKILQINEQNEHNIWQRYVVVNDACYSVCHIIVL